jgi:putative Holliday junction resolvase
MMPNRPAHGELVLGFDYGTRRIGVALGHRQLGSAKPLAIITNRDVPDWAALDTLVTRWQPHVLVIGQPPAAPSARSRLVLRGIRRFAEALRQRHKLPVVLVDEHLSSWAARRESGRLPPIRNQLDALAAACIVETYLHGPPDAQP